MVCTPCMGIVASAETSNSNVIDVYLIAGQSNAAGWSPMDTVNFSNYDSQYTEGFDNVLYYGKVPTSNTLNHFELDPVKAGLGYTASHFGPELGMASVLQDEENKVAIVKYAIGGSFLAPETAHKNATTGTWTSPSYISNNSIDITNTNIGKHYRDWETNLQNALTEMVSQGYDPVIKGIVWHQGEAETDAGFEHYANDYVNMLTCLINDFRASVSTITGDDYSKLPVVLGKISKAQNITSSVEVVRNAQQLVSDTVENVFITDATDFTKVDSWHLTGADMITHGQNCANVLLSSAGKKKLSLYSDGNGTLNGGGYKEIGESVTISYTANKGYTLESAKIEINNEIIDITEEFTNGIYSFDMPDYPCTISVSFSALPAFDITTKAENGNIYYTNAHRDPFMGEKVTFTFVANEGYALDKVFVNGVEVEPTAQKDNYIYTVDVQEDITVEAVYVQLPVEESTSVNPLEPIPPKLTFKLIWQRIIDFLFGWMFK